VKSIDHGAKMDQSDPFYMIINDLYIPVPS